MKEIKDFNMYDNSSLSFMFEFKSPIRRRDLASKFSKNLGKKVKRTILLIRIKHLVILFHNFFPGGTLIHPQYLLRFL